MSLMSGRIAIQSFSPPLENHLFRLHVCVCVCVVLYILHNEDQNIHFIFKWRTSKGCLNVKVFKDMVWQLAVLYYIFCK